VIRTSPERDIQQSAKRHEHSNRHQWSRALRPAIPKRVVDDPAMEIVAINDMADVEALAYLLRFDIVYGRYQKCVTVEKSDLVIAGRKLQSLDKRDALELPWKELGVQLVIECTGASARREDLGKHVVAHAELLAVTRAERATVPRDHQPSNAKSVVRRLTHGRSRIW
jgi:glyceraldehyde-3-phosphate dehydrogenase/erythrose-4-phosphate dehydrogenase